jgi:hypothetical protein
MPTRRATSDRLSPATPSWAHHLNGNLQDLVDRLFADAAAAV